MHKSSAILNQKNEIGRYAIYGEIASGGMATVHFGRLVGAAGFTRTVAIKRLHKQFASDPEFVAMLLDEARICARVQHPNVVSILDVVPRDGELFLVMEYIQGETLSRLMKAARRQTSLLPLRISAAIVSGMLHGLHAAHEAKSESGEPLHIVHRDVSPQNVLIGIDGVSKILDFGVAKAAGRVQSTRTGEVKGKLAYMAPEQLWGSKNVDRRVDVYAAAIVLWEALTGKRLIEADNEGGLIAQVMSADFPPPSTFVPDLSPALDAVVMRGLERNLDKRWPTTRAMAIALEEATPIAIQREVGEWVEKMATESLLSRAEQIAEIESSSSVNSAQQRTLEALTSTETLVEFTTVDVAPLRKSVASSSTPTLTDAQAKSFQDADSTVTTTAVSARVATFRQRNLLPVFGGALIFVTGVAGTALFLRPTNNVAPGVVAPIMPVATRSSVDNPSFKPPTATSLSKQPTSEPALVPSISSLPSPGQSSTPVLGKKSNRPPNITAAPIPNNHPPSETPKTSCTPPFIIDAAGIRRMKTECL